MYKTILLLALLFIAACSPEKKENCDYKSANLYLYPFCYTVAFPMKIDRIKTNSSTKSISFKDRRRLGIICKKVLSLETLNIQEMKSFDSRLVVELVNSSSEIEHIAVHSTKELIFFADNFYKCDNDCQKEIIEPLLSKFIDE